MYVGSILRQGAHQASAGDQSDPALSLEDRMTWTRADLVSCSNRYANGLLEWGVRPGDRVAILFENSLEYWAMYFAITRIGAIAVRVNWRLTGSEIGYSLQDSGTRLLCTHARFAPAVAEAVAGLNGCDCVVFDVAKGGESWREYLPAGRPHEDLLSDDSGEPTVADPELRDSCMIMYTSGTTGRPKGVLWTHGNTLWFLAMQAMHWHYDHTSVHLATTPMFHISGLEDWCLPVLMSGGHCVVMASGGLTARRVVKVVDHHRVRETFLVPSVIYELLSDPSLTNVELPSLERLRTGGAPLLGWAVDEFRGRFPHVAIEQVYGLTEGGAMTTAMDPSRLDEHRNSVGRPLPFAEVKIVDQSSSAAVATGVTGELWTRSPAMSCEYWGNAAASAAAFTGGWCKTGDLAKITDDGFVYIVGRIKDMIISGGENIYPAEIESVLAEHPMIREVAVVGVSHEVLGETPCAVVVAREGSELSEADVVAYCREKLAGYKRPRVVTFVEELPRNANGKIRKDALRIRLWGGTPEPGM